MKLVSPAKLTLSLEVLGRRDDGYHLIEAEMASLDFADTLEVEEVDGESKVEVVSAIDGSVIDIGESSENLVFKALDYVGVFANVKVHKSIPVGAGLGGGSSNAAAILRWAKSVYGNQIKNDLFNPADIALYLGADVVFCLRGGRARVSGVGEVVEPLDFVEEIYTLLTPPFGCVTAEVYKAFDEVRELDRQNLKAGSQNLKGANGLKGASGNDLEFAALAVYPELAFYCDRLGEISGKTPRLAGSGSTWFVEGEYEGEGLVVTRTTQSFSS